MIREFLTSRLTDCQKQVIAHILDGHVIKPIHYNVCKPPGAVSQHATIFISGLTNELRALSAYGSSEEDLMRGGLIRGRIID